MYTRSGARHTWPALKPLDAMMRDAATSRLASAATITGDLPPSSSVTGVRCSAAAFMTSDPTAPLPV